MIIYKASFTELNNSFWQPYQWRGKAAYWFKSIKLCHVIKQDFSLLYKLEDPLIALSVELFLFHAVDLRCYQHEGFFLPRCQQLEFLHMFLIHTCIKVLKLLTHRKNVENGFNYKSIYNWKQACCDLLSKPAKRQFSIVLVSFKNLFIRSETWNAIKSPDKNQPHSYECLMFPNIKFQVATCGLISYRRNFEILFIIK